MTTSVTAAVVRDHRRRAPRHPLLAILALASLSACGEPAGPDGAAELFGQWDVVRACGGFFGSCHEPERPTTFAFTRPDSVVIEVGDSVAFRRRFMVVEDAATMYGTYDAIHVWVASPGEWRPWMTILHLSADTLGLGDNMADGFGTELVRVRR